MIYHFLQSYYFVILAIFKRRLVLPMIDTNFSFNIGTLWFPGCKDGVTTVGGNALGACCKFPFIYKGTVHWRCTDQEANKKWCSVTKVFDFDRKWGYCTW